MRVDLPQLWQLVQALLRCKYYTIRHYESALTQVALPCLRVIMRILITLLCSVMLFGCSQLAPVSVFSVSEADLEQLLMRKVPELTRQANVAGIPLKMAVDQMSVQIGPDNSDVIRIQTAANASLSLFGLTYPADLQLQVEGVPYYDASEQVVYVRSVKLLNSSIEAAGYRGNLTPVSNELLQLVNQFLATNPVYRFDREDPKVKLLTAMPLNLAVQQGRIAFIPGASSGSR